MQLLEHFIREDLNKRSPRVMAVLKPLKIVIDNYPEQDPKIWRPSTIRKMPLPARVRLPFSRTLYIEQDDFLEDPPNSFSGLPQDAKSPSLRLHHQMRRV